MRPFANHCRQFFAHTVEGVTDTDQWEPLADHLENVSRLAEQFSSKFEAAAWGRLVGLWHDLGKYQQRFQDRLNDNSIHAPHAGVGAAHVMAVKNTPLTRLLAFIIAGHHAGLANEKDEQGSPRPLQDVLREFTLIAEEIFPVVEPSIRDVTIPSPPVWLSEAFRETEKTKRRPTDVPGNRHLAFFTRMLFSALVDADRLETARFYARAEGRPAPHDELDYDGLVGLRDRLDGHVDRMTEEADKTPVNRLRSDVLAACRMKAEESPGLFSLTVPTGGGKTLAAMSFALNHALARDMQRVIVVIPFTSIIEQTAKAYREAFSPIGRGEEDPDSRNVLEHHSAFDETTAKEENQEIELRRRTAAENWDAPVIVTTTVQFFESLFSNHPGRCRKLHRIAGSVVILDEVQTLPPYLVKPILQAIRELTDHYRCTIVLSTATPPALEKSGWLSDGLTNVTPIIDDSAELFARPAARRVCCEWRIEQATTYADLAAEMRSNDRVLAIVHKRQDARELFDALPSDDASFHLSALMCPAHRSEIVARIKTRLAKEQRCRLVSTQLIEAGVDVDFPVVYRALAGVDSLAQSAGRCDREGKLTAAAGEPAGRFIVFRAPTPPPAGTLRAAQSATESLKKLLAAEGTELDPFDPEHGRLFFREFYGTQDLNRGDILSEIEALNFANVAALFQMIDDGTNTVVVPWGQGAERAEAFRRNPGRDTARALQPFSVSVNPRYYNAILDRGLIETVKGYDGLGLATDLFGRTWYDEQTGLQPDAEAGLDPEVLMK